MSTPVRILLLVFGILAAGGLAAAVWFYAAVPYLNHVKQTEQAEAEAGSAQSELAAMQAESRKLQKVTRRGLPAGPEYPGDALRTRREYADVARSEYEQALIKILKDAGARNSTVNFSDAESNQKTGIPQVDPAFRANKDSDPAEYLAYTQVVFRIDIPKTDLATVADLLRRYYSLDLLHQITHLNIKQAGNTELGDDKRPQKDRNDLKVEITTRAIIVNGADRRRSLTPAPNPLVGLVGGLGGASYEQNPAVARKVLPEPFEPILASAPIREYQYLAAKDVYHGLLPQPEPPKVVVKPPEYVEPPPLPKPDLREYISYTTSIHTSQGDAHTVEVTIRDKANNEDYMLTITQEGEKVVAKATKYTFENHKIDPAERKKRDRFYDPKVLDISRPATMSNKNLFTVYGVDTDGSLVLGERPSGLTPELPKDDKKPAFGGGRPTTKPVMPPPDPKASVVGGLVVTAPKPEKFYRWQPGTTLKQIVELSKAEAETTIKRVQTRFLPTPAATTPPPVPAPAEAKVTDKP